MKNVIKVVVGIVIGAVLVFAYFFYKGLEQNINHAEIPKTPQLHLEIFNKASKPIRRLIVESPKANAISEHYNLIFGDKIYKNHPLAGESTSRLFIEFENGKKLYSAESYVESGYTLVQTIYDDSVHTDFK